MLHIHINKYKYISICVYANNNSDKISQTTVLRIEPTWDINSAPALIKTKEIEHYKIQEPTRTEETKILTSTNKASPT